MVDRLIIINTLKLLNLVTKLPLSLYKLLNLML